MTGSEIMQVTRAGLETGFRVRHIATMKLFKSSLDDNFAEVAMEATKQGFDCVPVSDETGVNIVGYLNLVQERIPALDGPIRGHMRRLDSSVLISGDAPLEEFIRGLDGDYFKLVVTSGGVSGIVTQSDLQKLPVRLLTFSLITHLEMIMGAAIKALLPDSNDWLDRLDDTSRKRITKEANKRKKERMDLDWLELTHLSDKYKILGRFFGLGEDYTRELHGITDLRNKIAHADSICETSKAIEIFIAQFGQIDHWTNYIEDEAGQRLGKPLKIF